MRCSSFCAQTAPHANSNSTMKSQQAMEGQVGVPRVANARFVVLFEQAVNRYYLKAGSRWVSAAELNGPWADTKEVPPAVMAAGNELATPATQPSQGAVLSPAAADA